MFTDGEFLPYLTTNSYEFVRVIKKWLIRTNSYDLTRANSYDLSKPT